MSTRATSSTLLVTAGLFVALVPMTACGGSAVVEPTDAEPGAGPPASSPAPAESRTPEATPGETGESPVNPAWSASACPAPAGNVGFAVGDSLGDLGVKDCDTGADATLDDVCGASATWIFAAHTHCPTCQATAAFTDDVAKAVAAKNVAVVQLVYDDNGTSCAEWRAAYKLAGHANVRVYADPGGAAFAKLKSANYTAASAFLDTARVITFKQHGMSKSAVLAQIDATLAAP